MIFDQSWMNQLLELQKKAAELTHEKFPTNGMEGFIREVLNQWGGNNSNWAENLESVLALWQNNNPASFSSQDSNVDIAESKETIKVTLAISGITGPAELSIRLQNDDTLLIERQNETGAEQSFHRKIRLPAKVTGVGSAASYQKDKLTVSLPKLDNVAEQTIPVTITTQEN